MVDFIKAIIPNKYREGLLRNPLLEFEQVLNIRTAVLGNKLIAEYKGMKFILYIDSTYCELQGSVHKYYNDGIHNADQFGLNQLWEVIIEFNVIFCLPLETLRLINVEFGVNILPPTIANTILNNLLLHNNTKFKDVQLRSGNYKQATHQRYYIKAYNKRLQYSNIATIPQNEIMRFELKFVKMTDLHKEGIHNLNNLFSETSQRTVRALIIQRWNECLMFDKTIDRGGLSEYYKETKYHQWNNANYWLGLSKHQKSREMKSYRKIILEYSSQIHLLTGQIILTTFDSLINDSTSITQKTELGYLLTACI